MKLKNILKFKKEKKSTKVEPVENLGEELNEKSTKVEPVENRVE